MALLLWCPSHSLEGKWLDSRVKEIAVPMALMSACRIDAWDKYNCVIGAAAHHDHLQRVRRVQIIGTDNDCSTVEHPQTKQRIKSSNFRGLT